MAVDGVVSSKSKAEYKIEKAPLKGGDGASGTGGADEKKDKKGKDSGKGHETKDSYSAGGAVAFKAESAAKPDEKKDGLDDPALKLTDKQKSNIRAARDGGHDSRAEKEDPAKAKDSTSTHTRQVLENIKDLPPDAKSEFLKKIGDAKPGDIKDTTKSLDELTSSKGYKKLSAAQKADVAKVVGKTDKASLESVKQIVTSDNFAQLSDAQTTKLLGAMNRSDKAGLSTLAQVVPSAEFKALSTGNKDAILESLGTGDKAAIASILKSGGFQGLTDAQKSQVLTLAGRPAKSQPIAELITSPAFQRLTPAQAAQVLDVAGAAGAQGLRDLKTLVNNPARLNDKSPTDGSTLLDNLSKFATQSLHPELVLIGVPKAQLMDDLLSEVANPANVTQNSYGTCSVTSVQYELVRDDPSEYARLMTGLCGTEGRAQMRNGDYLELQTEYLVPRMDDPTTPAVNETDGRSFTEAYFQGAAMEYTGGWANYDASTDHSSYPIFPWASWQGNFEGKLLSGLYGKQYNNVSLYSEAEKNIAIDFLEKYDPMGKANTPITLNLYLAPDNPDGLHSAHAMTFIKAENGRVYFRNQWGPDGNPAGTTLSGGLTDGWRVENPSEAVYSMSYADFEKKIYAINIPDDAAAAYQQPNPVPDKVP